MGFKFKIAYTKDKTTIPEALNEGTINKGDLIIVENGEEADGEFVFIAEDGRQMSFFSKDIINTIQNTITTSEEVQQIIKDAATDAVSAEGAFDAGEM